MLFGSEVGRDREHWHQCIRIDIVKFYFFGNFYRVFKCFGNVGKNLPHLLGRLQPFLLGVAHAVGIVEIFTGAEAN